MAILGLRDTGSYAADRFQNWRREILYSFPNGMAPLTALLSLTEPEETNDPHYHWYEEPLTTQRSNATASFNGVVTSISVADAVFRVGHQIMDENTGEQMEVTAVDSTGLVLTVYRNAALGQAASAGAADNIVIIGNINAEGGDTPQSIQDDPTPVENITQIYRTPLKLTGTAMNTALKYDRTGPYKEALRQALSRHSIEMEKSFHEGRLLEWADPSTGEIKRTTKGIVQFLPAGYKYMLPGAGVLDGDTWSNYLELVFRVCSNPNNEKLCLVGSGALNALNRLAEKVGKMETVAGDEAFGMALTRWYTPFGTLYLRTHPLYTQHPVWRYRILILDVHNLTYRHVTGRDTTRLTNRQSNGRDSRVDEFLTEAGLEVHHVGTGSDLTDAKNGTHLLLENVKSATAS